jgi:hypothetical protein
MSVLSRIMLTQKGLRWAVVQRVVQIHFRASEGVGVRVSISIVANLVIFEWVAVVVMWGVVMSLGSEKGPF